MPDKSPNQPDDATDATPASGAKPLESRPSSPGPSQPALTIAEQTPVPTSLVGLRKEPPRWLALAAGAFCLFICVILWGFTTSGSGEERLLGHNQLPSIPETWERLPEVLDSKSPERHIWDNTAVSLKRVIVGFALAVVIGIPIGVAAGCFPIARNFFAPLVLFGRNIPIAALIPLALALFGTGETQKYMFIFIACVAFIIADTIDAVSEVAQRYVETALTLGASSMQIVFKVLVPLAMPMVFNSLRVLFGLAFGYIMLVEFMHEGDGAGGLGFLLNIARRRSVTEYTMIIILTIPLVAWIIDQLLYVIQCWLFRWKYGKEAERSSAFRLSRWLLRLFWNPTSAPATPTAGS
ncbi:ABC transporter permease [Fuerstiella marisgermanici]|uniref:Bicarbonate transport system permease protein CmpB n=1 Tax=Fuerstiella marisgermanici TaxID=1891926 RepID=A0A1P8WRS0_9PLAN|nr:ABC transporter permease subunit [Fuerstiella marisgermanici]APZ96752.1 Bicarbonate transport system permease protein CmpB [Fuerstiella marisgermanici]